MGWGFVCCVATRVVVVVVVVKQTETSMAAVGTGRAFHFLHRRPSCGLLWLWVGWALTAERRETEWRRARRSLSLCRDRPVLWLWPATRGSGSSLDPPPPLGSGLWLARSLAVANRPPAYLPRIKRQPHPAGWSSSTREERRGEEHRRGAQRGALSSSLGILENSLASSHSALHYSCKPP